MSVLEFEKQKTEKPDDNKSRRLFERALRVAPSGVHSDFRQAFPHFFKFADGPIIEDVDGNRFIDYHMAFGAILLGHRNKKVIDAVKLQLDQGDLWGMGSHELELEVAEKIVQYVPSAEKVRFCNSGSEASYHAVRLARAFTAKRKIIKFEGSYNGWHDYLDLGVFPSKENLGTPQLNSAGILEEAAKNTLVVPYNDKAAVEKCVKENSKEIAAIIVEPILHSCGCILPEEGFLESLSELSQRYDCLLIFDEVITGFRHDLGGAQKILGVTPNVTIFAKALGGGFPIGAICGDKEIMDQIEPLGKVHVAGTFCGHPISMAAAKATIDQLEGGAVHEKLSKSGDYLRNEISKIIKEESIPASLSIFKSVFAVYFSDKKFSNYKDLKLSNDEELFGIYCKKMHENGIFIAPQSYKRSHISASHGKEDLEKTVEAARIALQACKQQLRI
jgi:glutamate-1-semialdehyde 2,1-aminomutase